MSVPWSARAGVVLFLLVLVSLVVRTHVHGDDRYGLSMFRDVTVYTLRYDWIGPGGETRPIQAEKYLVGDSLVLRPGKRPLDTILGLYSLQDRVSRFVAWLAQHPDQAGGERVRGVLRYKVYDRGPWQQEVWEVPVGGASP